MIFNKRLFAVSIVWAVVVAYFCSYVTLEDWRGKLHDQNARSIGELRTQLGKAGTKSKADLKEEALENKLDAYLALTPKQAEDYDEWTGKDYQFMPGYSWSGCIHGPSVIPNPYHEPKTSGKVTVWERMGSGRDAKGKSHYTWAHYTLDSDLLDAIRGDMLRDSLFRYGASHASLNHADSTTPY